MKPFSSMSGSEDQAALWAARIEGSELTMEDRRALDTWLAEDPAHRRLLSEYCQLSADLEYQLPALVASGALMPSATAQAASPARPARFARGLTWGGLAAAAALVFAFWIFSPARGRELITLAGQRQSLVLADGSHVDLNANTHLRVEMRRAARHILLTQGEAYFMVTKDPSRPFIVETPDGTVRVTGTVFDVRAPERSRLEVTVVEGAVQVRAGLPSALPVMLHPGDRLDAQNEVVGLTTLSHSALADATAWREGQVVFDGVPLSDALARFAAYHSRSIIASAAAANLKLGGRFSLDDLDGFLAALEEVLPVKVTRDANGVVHVALRSEH